MCQCVAVPVSHRQIGRAILDMLRDKRLSQREMADAIDMAHSYLSRRLKGGGREFHTAELERMAKFLGLYSASELLDLAERKYDRGIPLLGTVPGGPMNVHWQHWDDIEACDTWLDRSPDQEDRDLFAVRVSGDSMAPEMPQGTVVICKPIPRDANGLNLEGKAVVVSMSDEDPANGGATTIGIWRERDDGTVVLQKRNADLYGPIMLDLDAVVSISVVVEYRRAQPHFPRTNGVG